MEAFWQELAAQVPDTLTVLRVAFRLCLALALSAVLGWQRERAGKPAGLRTHMLVSLGACLSVLAPLQAGMPVGDVSRVVQGLITGIGFLGAGAIIRLDRGSVVKGLTSAASIWVTASLGVAAGLGTWFVATAGVALAWVVLAALAPLERRTTMPSAPRIELADGESARETG